MKPKEFYVSLAACTLNCSYVVGHYRISCACCGQVVLWRRLLIGLN
jgi:hypothetical protein